MNFLAEQGLKAKQRTLNHLQDLIDIGFNGKFYGDYVYSKDGTKYRVNWKLKKDYMEKYRNVNKTDYEKEKEARDYDKNWID